jgi:hypothetical protein
MRYLMDRLNYRDPQEKGTLLILAQFRSSSIPGYNTSFSAPASCVKISFVALLICLRFWV